MGNTNRSLWNMGNSSSEHDQNGKGLHPSCGAKPVIQSFCRQTSWLEHKLKISRKKELSRGIRTGDIAAVKTFLKDSDLNDVILDGARGRGVSPIHLAASCSSSDQGTNEVLKLLVQHSSTTVIAETLLDFAADDNYCHEMSTLIQNGCDVNTLHNNKTVLHVAMENRCVKMVHLLLRLGADPRIRGYSGATVLEEAHRISDPAFAGMMKSCLMGGHPTSSYDYVDHDKVKTKLASWARALKRFAKKHHGETFYVLALNRVTATLMANTEEAFDAEIARHRQQLSSTCLKNSRPRRCISAQEVRQRKHNSDIFKYHQIDSDSEDCAQQVNNLCDPGREDLLDFSFLRRKDNDSRTEIEILYDGLVANQAVLAADMTRSRDFAIIRT